MKSRSRLVVRAALLALLLAAGLVTSSCNGSSGVGVGVGYPTRWGGGSTQGPPIFVGGPSF
jgi:predicted small secreted protein